MLPPIPTGVIPVAAQQDVVKPRPEVAPVTPVQASSDESAVTLDRRHPQESGKAARRATAAAASRLYPEELAKGETDEQDQAALEELPRQGLWVDVEV